MSLIKCSECGNEISNDAIACPNCGHPINNPTIVPPRVIVADSNIREEGLPKWIIAPIAILGAIAVFLAITFVRNSDDNSNNRNNNINVATQQKSSATKDSTSRTEKLPNQVEVPSSSTTVNPPVTKTVPQNIPQTVKPLPQSEVSSIPADKGLVIIDAKVTTKAGDLQSVKNEKFYLLDEDLESILGKANLQPTGGQSLADSFGLAVLYPEKYSEFHNDSLNAIKKHIKYDTTTDSSGKASIRDVKPNSYYLFGITKTRNGFAIWNSTVSIIGGENKLNLSPARINEIQD